MPTRRSSTATPRTAGRPSHAIVVRLTPAVGARRSYELRATDVTLGGFQAALAPRSSAAAPPDEFVLGSAAFAEITLPDGQPPLGRFTQLIRIDARHKNERCVLRFAFCGGEDPALFDAGRIRIQEFLERRQSADV